MREDKMKKDVIRMAREAGIHHAFDSEGHWDGLTDTELIERHPPSRQTIEYGEQRMVEILERFAALVAAAEREACAKYFDEHWRETWTDEQIAEAIRARGQA